MFQLSRSLIALVKVSLERTMAPGGHFHSAVLYKPESIKSKSLGVSVFLSTENPFKSAWVDI